jgi:hypothetical protein
VVITLLFCLYVFFLVSHREEEKHLEFRILLGSLNLLELQERTKMARKIRSRSFDQDDSYSDLLLKELPQNNRIEAGRRAGSIAVVTETPSLKDSIEYQHPSTSYSNLPTRTRSSPPIMSTTLEHFFAPTHVFRTKCFPFEFTELQLTMPVEQTFQIIASGIGKLYGLLLCDRCDNQNPLDLQEAFLVVARNAFHFYDINGISKIHAVIQDSRRQQTLILAHRGIEVSTGEAGVFDTTTSDCVKLTIENNFNYSALPSGPILSLFLQSPSLQVLELKAVCFEEEHCRALRHFKDRRISRSNSAIARFSLGMQRTL